MRLLLNNDEEHKRLEDFRSSQIAIYLLYVVHSNKILRMHDVLATKFLRKKIVRKVGVKIEKES